MKRLGPRRGALHTPKLGGRLNGDTRMRTLRVEISHTHDADVLIGVRSAEQD